MNEARRIFEGREKEIEHYFIHLQKVEEGSNDTLFRILKANLLLMLYNIVEATISNAIDAIRLAIHNDQNVNFDCLKNEIRVQIIRDLKKNVSPDHFIKSSKDISHDIAKLSFKKEEISRGNIDRSIIIDLSKIYGFNVNDSNYQETGHGNTLVSIKEKRNDLAHGTFSFADVGKEYTMQDLEKYKNQTIKYIGFILDSIESYLINQEYKQPAA